MALPAKKMTVKEKLEAMKKAKASAAAPAPKKEEKRGRGRPPKSVTKTVSKKEEKKVLPMKRSKYVLDEEQNNAIGEYFGAIQDEFGEIETRLGQLIDDHPKSAAEINRLGREARQAAQNLVKMSKDLRAQLAENKEHFVEK